MIPVQVGKRAKGYFPEVRYSRGPRVMAETGDNSFQTLLGYLWMAVLDRSRGFRLFQAQVPGEGPWALDDPRGPEVAVWVEVEAPPLPHPAREVRHLAFCFDQAARHVVAYEHEGQVWVRQWDPVAQAYRMRGPFPGVDPVLLWDFEVGYFLPDSDVLLFHLSPDRTQVLMRVQRELYDPPRVVATFDEPVLLDQALALPYQGEVLGSLASDPDRTGVVLRTDLYPVHLQDQAGGASVSPPQDWTLIPVVLTYQSQEAGAQAQVQPPTAWTLIPVVILYRGDDLAASASVLPPTAWDYRLVVVVYNGGSDLAASAAISPPVEWNYFV